MKILVTGACGFVGSTLAQALVERDSAHRIVGIDNFIRPGSETNRERLRALGVEIRHGDIRLESDVDSLPAVDFVIDAAANPSVLAGVDGRTSARQLIEHNLLGTINLLEYCARHRAGFILLGTSRVYSIPPLARLSVEVADRAFRPVATGLPAGITTAGIDESFSTAAPVSLYGATKLASETLALEYAGTYGLSVFVDRCGVLAGAGQFGRPDQGIFSFWINSYLRRRPLAYIGFDGEGHQVRDCLHPRDLVPLLEAQIGAGSVADEDRVVNCSGGAASARSLRQVSDWCAERFGPHEVGRDPSNRRFDLPWVVLDSGRARARWNWQPTTGVEAILEEIAVHARDNPSWLDISASS